MSLLTFAQWVGWALIAVLCLWIAVRVAAAAYFRSKADYDKEHQHGTQKQPR